ncbi:tRNA-dihydrouridine(16) synthase-like isoform X2 [Trifolium pratense]|uniref:tRNA-dihydrouridine(16) synthase-like isoform X2 n=1 Tax=Trifolium pratense TaxID=57577 RepID=UPI001E6982C1|nr:tRNA-dihydrouridine(16) synthase-like isoform X2 [Trifolium pratense]
MPQGIFFEWWDGCCLLSKPELISDASLIVYRCFGCVELARRIEKTGVDAIAVHGRYVLDRPRDPAKWSGIADVVSALSIPVIANGDVFEYDDFQRIKSATGI